MAILTSTASIYAGMYAGGGGVVSSEPLYYSMIKYLPSRFHTCISTAHSYIYHNTQIIGVVSLWHVLFGINTSLVCMLIFLCCM